MTLKESIQSQGGKARFDALTEEQRKIIASKAATARWGKPIQAIRKGNFKEQFGIDVECYVLDDIQKTAVLSQRGMGRTLGLDSSGGKALPRFLATKAMASVVGAELSHKLSQPIKFQWGGGGAENPRGVIFGFDATILIDVCRAIIIAEAEGKLAKRYDRVAAQAHIILNASAKSGIRGLVYALAGYSPATEEVIAAFKVYVQEEAKKYEKEFPPELYVQWHRLFQIPQLPRGRSWHFKHLTVKHIYYPLAQSNGKLLQLMRALKASGGDQKAKLFQFLNEVGARALRIHLGRVVEMAESSPDKVAYEKRIVERFGGQQELELVISASPPQA